jgi:DNA-directed RNA polymerase I and III subunit RPAC2
MQSSNHDETCATIKVYNEGHTMGNSIRYMLARNKQTDFVGYSIPHPNEPIMNIRVQTNNGKPAVQLYNEALDQLEVMTRHISTKFEDALLDFDKRSRQKGQ